MKKVVAIVGDYYHDGELYTRALMEALTPLIVAKKIELKFAKAMDISNELNKHPDMVILAVEDRVDPQVDPDLKWMIGKVSDQIAAYVEQGGAWFGWHSGLASYDVESSYVKMLRGYFISHPDQNKPVRYTPTEALTFGEHFEPFAFIDEHYMVACDEAKTTVFLRSTSEDGESIGGWHHSFGQGRVCCLTPAHRREGLLDPTFTRLLRSSLNWTVAL